MSLCGVSTASAETATSTAVTFSYRLGKGLTARGTEDRFELVLGTRVQVRYSAQTNGETRHAAAVRRARVDFRGFVGSPAIRFRLHLAVSGADIDLEEQGRVNRAPVLDGYIDVRLAPSLALRVGQDKTPHNRERLQSSSDTRLVDRSIVDDELTLDRDVGITAFGEIFAGRVAYWAGIYGGEGHSPLGLEEPAFLYLARVDVRPFGDFDALSTVDFERRPAPDLAIGGVGGFLGGAERARGNRGAPLLGETQDLAYWAADLLLLWRGWSVQAEALGRRRVDGDADARDAIGVYGEVGYLLPWLPVSLAARVARVEPWGADSVLPGSSEAAFGVQYHVYPNAVRFQVDYSRVWNDVADNTHLVRAQLEVEL